MVSAFLTASALFVAYTRLIGFSILVGAVTSWWAGIAVLAATMTFRYGHRGGLRMYMRVFGLTTWMTERFRASSMASLEPLWISRRRVNGHHFLGFAAIGITVFSAVLVTMLRSAAAGEITLTQVPLGLQATVGAILLGEFYHEADIATQFGMHSAMAAWWSRTGASPRPATTRR